MNIDSTTNSLISMWAKHCAEGKAKGIDDRHEWQTAPEWAYLEADEWVRRDQALRMLIGTQLADQALREFQNSAGVVA